jgi:hypothetical protein
VSPRAIRQSKGISLALVETALPRAVDEVHFVVIGPFPSEIPVLVEPAIRWRSDVSILPSADLAFQPIPRQPVPLNRHSPQTEQTTSFLRQTCRVSAPQGNPRGMPIPDIDGPRRTSRTACSTNGWMTPVHVRGLRVGSAGSPPHEGAYQNSNRLRLKGKLDKHRQTPSTRASFQSASPKREARANARPCFALQAWRTHLCQPFSVGLPYPLGNGTQPRLSRPKRRIAKELALFSLCANPQKSGTQVASAICCAIRARRMGTAFPDPNE